MEPSAAVCEALSKFYDSSDPACVDFLTCDGGKVLRAEDNTCNCPSGEEFVNVGTGSDTCIPVDKAEVAQNCRTALWSVYNIGVSNDDILTCEVITRTATGVEEPFCVIYDETASTQFPKCADAYDDPPLFPTAAGTDDQRSFVWNCSQDGSIDGALPALANTISATECGCDSGTLRPGACIPAESDSPNFDGIAEEFLCGAFGGTVQIATGGEAGRRVCSGMDDNDTFCILDAAEADGVRAFPCRGLFKHLRSCNLEFDRPALNPFFCGKKCADPTPNAVGSNCRP